MVEYRIGMTREEWEAGKRAEAAEKVERLKAAHAALLAKGVDLFVSACGCCNGPTVSLKIDGVTLLEDEDEANLPPYEPKE